MQIGEKILSLLLSLYMSLVPFASSPAQPMNEVQSSEMILDVALFSDTHIKGEDSLSIKNFTRGIDNLSANYAGTDAVAFCGDLTNGGKESSLKLFYETLKAHSTAEKFICAPGNHDVGLSALSNDDARKLNIEYRNEYINAQAENIYYSTDVNGYGFIVIGDDIGNKSNTPVISDEQLAFLDNALANATENGKPAFVLCHWPLCKTNGLERLWPGGGVSKETSEDIKNILKKYNNVFFISGHTHGGLTSERFERFFGYSCVETDGGVTYVSLPTYGKFNRHGPLSPSIYVRMEVYADRIVFRPINLRKLKEYPDYNKTVLLSGSYND